jgi:hypothetical protein
MTPPPGAVAFTATRVAAFEPWAPRASPPPTSNDRRVELGERGGGEDRTGRTRMNVWMASQMESTAARLGGGNFGTPTSVRVALGVSRQREEMP